MPLESPSLRADGKVEVGAPCSDFRAPVLGGGELHLASTLRDKTVLLQFWGIRCAPCLAEMEFLSELQERYRDRGLQVVGVNTDRVSPAKLAEAMQARSIQPPYPVVLDPDAAIAQHYTHWLIPVTVLIGRDGFVRALHTGYKQELNSLIESEILESL